MIRRTKMKARLTIEDGREIEVDISQSQIDELCKPEPPEPVGMWEPKKKERYWSITSCGEASQFSYETKLNKLRLGFGNIYKTKEQAEKAAETMRKHNRVLAWLTNNDDGWKADWDDAFQAKWYMFLDHREKWVIDYIYYYMAQGTVYMSEANAKELARQINEGEFIL
jgi:hypothetical protein